MRLITPLSQLTGHKFWWNFATLVTVTQPSETRQPQTGQVGSSLSARQRAVQQQRRRLVETIHEIRCRQIRTSVETHMVRFQDVQNSVGRTAPHHTERHRVWCTTPAENRLSVSFPSVLCARIRRSACRSVDRSSHIAYRLLSRLGLTIPVARSERMSRAAEQVLRACRDMHSPLSAPP